MKRLAVLGQPVSRSRSPAMHNAALEALGLGGEWRYEAIEVGPEEFVELVDSMEEEGFAGANVTVPHKGAALAVAEEISEVAREVGAANTLSFGNGVVHAFNTDAEGFLRSLPEPPGSASALVLGAGGAARAVVWGLVRKGAEVEVWNRTELRSANLCAELGGTPTASPDQGVADLIVNTTAVGLRGEDPFAELPLSAAGFREGQTVVDLVYGERRSALLAAAEAAGAATVDGFEILARQGAISLRIWTGQDPPLDVMLGAARGD